jgi:glycine cleavage system H protein
MTPTDRKYTKDHEWIILEGENARVGITAHAQEALGDIVFVELPAVGTEIKAGESFAVVESVKAVSNVFTPVGGAVVEVNDALEAQPELLNEAPYDNYIALFKVAEIKEDELLDAAAYDAFVESEG